MQEIRSISTKGIICKVRLAVLNLKMFFVYVFYKMHLLNELTMRTLAFKALVAFFKNSSEGYIIGRARVFADNYQSLLRPEMQRIIKGHQTKSHTTILFSGMMQPYLDAVKQNLQFDIAIGTKLQVKDGRYTGKIEKLPYFGERRAQALSEVIRKLDFKVDLNGSFAYGDSILDRYYMGLVGNPVAVFPDNNLARFAQENGWIVIS